ncbi:MAG: BCSC C-terminal domain-containing protein [Burkholderiaceae bacterium]|nr:BCSC C-terminal domain-containing protein [Burkholderiaceae bacterium]
MNRSGRGIVPWAGLLLALVFAHSSALGVSPAPDPASELLRGARMWTAKNRADIAKQMLEKLLVMQPDSPEGLAMLADLALREGKMEEARRLQEILRTKYPSHTVTRELATLSRVYGIDREKLANMRLLARAGRKAEAADLARELFPEGPPTLGGLGLEYHQILGSSTQGGPEAVRQLERLYAQTGETRYRLAQLEMQMYQGAQPAAIVAQIEALARQPDVNSQIVRDLWRRAIDRLDNQTVHVPRLQAFLKSYPGDAAMTERLTAMQQGAERAGRTEQRPASETAVVASPRDASANAVPRSLSPVAVRRDAVTTARMAGREALDQGGKLEQAQAQWQALLALQPNDPEGLASLGIVRLRQGEYAQAEDLLGRAYQLAPQRKWQEAQIMASFLGLLKQANTALEQSDLPVATELIGKALALQPANTDALIVLAHIRTLEGSLPAARVLYEQVLKQNPVNKAALVGFSNLLVQQGQSAQALELLEKAAASDPALASALASARTDILAAQADEHIQAKRLDTARLVLESAIRINPEDPWICHRLARLHLLLEHKTEALTVMNEGIERMPKNSDMRYARALIRMALDDYVGTLDDLNQIAPADLTDGIKVLTQRAEIGKLVAQALQPDGLVRAPALLQSAQEHAGQDPELLQSVANAWGKLGQPAQGLAIFQRLVARLSPLPLAVELDYAQWMNRARSESALGQYLPELFNKSGWTAAQEAQLLGMYADLNERLIEGLQKSGDVQGAKRMAQAALPKTQITTHRARTRARLLMAAGEYVDASVQWGQALKENPDDVDARLDLGTALARQGRMPEAIEQAVWLRGRIPESDVGGQLSLLRLWQRTNDIAQARALADRLLLRFPTDSDVILHVARLERADGNYAQAVDFFRQAQRLIPKGAKTSDGQEPATEPIQREIDSIDTRQQSWVEAGQKFLQKDSAPGISSLHGTERSLVAWMPRSYDGRYFLHVDQLDLSAGKLPQNQTDALGFGQVAAWPSGMYPTDGPLQRNTGTNLGFGYVSDGYQWDIGVIGMGLPVTNVVGGLGKSGTWGRYSYKLEFARRPLTGSMLSYVGARDPITGQIWGGVVSTGLSGRISTDVGPYSLSFSASDALLSGQNVRDNNRWQLRWAADRDVLRAPGNVLNVGLALSLQGNARDLSEFSWGNGGYYSPRGYASLALPVEWSGRNGPWTWSARGSLSVSRSSSRESDYFPTNPALQAQALGLNNVPVYAGSSGTGFGRALRGAVEYQYSSQLSLGAQVEVERSAYYSPTNFLLYARYLLAPVRIPMSDKPRPTQSYSSF